MKTLNVTQPPCPLTDVIQLPCALSVKDVKTAVDVLSHATIHFASQFECCKADMPRSDAENNFKKRKSLIESRRILLDLMEGGKA